MVGSEGRLVNVLLLKEFLFGIRVVDFLNIIFYLIKVYVNITCFCLCFFCSVFGKDEGIFVGF